MHTVDDTAPSPTVPDEPPPESTTARMAASQPPAVSPTAAANPALVPSAGPTAITGQGWSGVDVAEEDELVGETLGGTYVIERVLGEGGMGRVYLAHHTRIQRKRFAIKSLHPEYVRRPDIVRRFRREAEAAAAISSDHVVGVYDVDEDHLGRPYIVAELLEGTELGVHLDRVGKMPTEDAVGVVRQICQALIAAHDKGVIHRDMKPENVFLVGEASQPTAKVIDFGISRLEDGQEGTALTKAGTVMGTPSYMPPEQARGTEVDHRADVYAVGAILYRALTGQVAFDRDDPMATVAAVLTEEPPRPRSLAPEIPEGLEVVIQRAMAKDRDQRFATMRELDVALTPHEGKLARVAGAVDAPPPLGGRTELVVLGVTGVAFSLLGLVAAGGSIVHLLRGYGPTTLELVIVLLTMGLGLATPLFLGIKAVRERLWSDSAKVQAAAQLLVRPVTAALAVFAAGSLVSALADFVLSSPRPGWAGWPAIWFALSLVAAAYAHWRRPARLGTDLVAALASVALVATLVATQRGASEQPTLAAPIGVESAAPAAPTASAVPVASEAELAEARKGGGKALAALSEKYPQDKAVLRTLLVAHGSTTQGLEPAMEVAERLHTVDPRALLDPLIENAVVEAASGPGPGRTRAMTLLATKMGSRGPDLLWDLAHGRTAAKADARALLARPDVQARGTPALQVAWAVEAAKGCEAKAALLDRVTQDGDARCVTLLRPLTVSRRCGPFKIQTCPAVCGKHVGAMKKAITAAEQRGSKG